LDLKKGSILNFPVAQTAVCISTFNSTPTFGLLPSVLPRSHSVVRGILVVDNFLN